MLAIIVNKKDAEKVKKLLLKTNLLDDNRKIRRYNGNVEFPIKCKPNIKIGVNYKIIEQKNENKNKNENENENIIFRKKFVPFEEIKKKLYGKISINDYKNLPKKWEKFGDVLVLKMKNIKSKKIVAETYAKILNCKTVLEDVGGISGIERKPNFKLLYGKDTETIHVENGIKYKFDVAKIMFSSGNIDERIRMSKIANKNEIVVDMFAGIGYFTLPIAVYSKAKVIACEINPIAYEYLKENILLNKVEKLVEVRLGDCRKVAPKKAADRIIMGYLDSIKFLSFAIEVLKNKGTIHLHQNCKEEEFPNKLIKKIKRIVEDKGKSVEILKYRKIKSYAPRILHVVFDLFIS